MSAESGESGLAPALAEALVPAAQAWALVRSGRSLETALEAVLAGDSAATQSGARLGGAVRDIVAAGVRRWSMLEALLAQLAQRPPVAPVAALLEVALAQLLAHSYSEFTLVDQAVRAAKARPETAAAAGFVNAVLREFLRRRADLEEFLVREPARRFNVPAWWLQRLQSEYGPRAQAVLLAQLEEPPLVLRVNCRRATPERVLAELAALGMEARPVGPSALWLRRPVPVAQIPGFREGRVSVQDAGAQLAAPWLGVEAGMRVLDACAAPGGKTAHLLEIADCRVDAVELSEPRAQRIEANLVRLGLSERARVLHADIREPGRYWDGVPYQRILLDAPCTASGVVRRHPDVLMLRRPADVAKLATQQAKMLRALWPLLAPAGRLLYVVCSVFAEEGRRQVSAFLQRQPGARQIRLPGCEPGGLQLLPSSQADLEPQQIDIPIPVLHDGFFYALLEKT